MKKLLAASAALLTIATAASAQPGLNGSYYTVGPFTSTTGAEAAIAGQTPAVTFTANTICFGGCYSETNDDTSLNAWLGDSTNISPNNITDISNHVVDLTGYINIATTGSYTFRIGSDDGSELYIDGTKLIDNDNIAPYASKDGMVTLDAGSHSIRLLQFENSGGSGFTASLVNDGVASPLNATMLSTNSGVPEPATWAMMLVGFGMVGAGLRYRRKSTTARFA